MANKTIGKFGLSVLVTTVIVSSFIPAFSQAKSEVKGLQIYLPRQKAIDGEMIDLASVAMIRGDEKLVAKARHALMGKFAMSGQQIVLDRNTIISRLASCGVDKSQVTISGSDVVTVKRQESVISHKRIVDVAKEKLMTLPEIAQASNIRLLHKPKDYILDSSDSNVSLAAKLGMYRSGSKVPVVVDFVEDGITIASRKVDFALTYKQQRAVAMRNIESGELLGPANIKLETVDSAKPTANDWQPPFGMIAKNYIRQGAVISQFMASPPAPAIVIERKQVVVVKLETPGISVTNVGEALSDGKLGQMIRVRVFNDVSKQTRIITGKVMDDGSVRPIFR